MPEHEPDTDTGGVQKATRSDGLGADDFETMSTRRYTVAPEEPLDVAIVYAVAAKRGVEPTQLKRPLQEVVDADALRRLFESADESLRATILVDGHEVTVADGGGELVVSEL